MKRSGLYAAIALLVVLVAAGLLGSALGPDVRTRFPSSFGAEPEGLLAFRRLLGEIGVPSEVRTRAWDEIGPEVERGFLLVATPLQRPVDSREEQAMRAWLGRGGALLVVDDASTLERSAGLDRIFADAGLPGRAPITGLDPETMSQSRPRLAAAYGTPARPAGSDLGRLMLHAEGGLDEGASGTPLALRDDAAIVAGEGALGNGRIVRVLGPLLANDRVLAADNLEFALRLVEDLRGEGPVAFDEYHHGFGGLSPVSRGLNGAALGIAALQALFAMVLYAASRGTRFGPPRLVPDPPRRSSLEFVHSMASLYKRAGARRHALSSELERLTRVIRSRLAPGGEAAVLSVSSIVSVPSIPLAPSIPSIPSIEALARSIATASGLSETRALGSLRAAEEAMSKPVLGGKEMLGRVADLARLEKEVLGGGIGGR